MSVTFVIVTFELTLSSAMLPPPLLPPFPPYPRIPAGASASKAVRSA
ncbi:MAG: hypothetical protein IPF92_19950 [Myxococcales bacterium]|nr:hypothetical protein [Myxococcales bacterium]